MVGFHDNLASELSFGSFAHAEGATTTAEQSMRDAAHRQKEESIGVCADFNGIVCQKLELPS
eukprot:2409781-Amphidinium_carterae.1